MKKFKMLAIAFAMLLGLFSVPVLADETNEVDKWSHFPSAEGVTVFGDSFDYTMGTTGKVRVVSAGVTNAWDHVYATHSSTALPKYEAKNGEVQIIGRGSTYHPVVNEKITEDVMDNGGKVLIRCKTQISRGFETSINPEFTIALRTAGTISNGTSSNTVSLISAKYTAAFSPSAAYAFSRLEGVSTANTRMSFTSGTGTIDSDNRCDWLEMVVILYLPNPKLTGVDKGNTMSCYVRKNENDSYTAIYQDKAFDMKSASYITFLATMPASTDTAINWLVYDDVVITSIANPASGGTAAVPNLAIKSASVFNPAAAANPTSRLTTLVDGSLTVSNKFFNMSDETKSLSIIIAKYKATGELNDIVKIDPITVAPSVIENEDVTIPVGNYMEVENDVTITGDDASVKVFVWDEIENMCALSEAYELRK